MKKLKITLLSTITMMTMAYTGSVFAAAEPTADIGTVNTLSNTVGVEYRGHIQNTGDYPLDNSWIKGPTELGTEGQGLRLEGFWIQLTGTIPDNAHIEYQVHVQNEGWMDWVADGEFAGTKDKSQRIEAIRIRLVDDDGNALSGFSVQYRGHIQNQGDTDWVADGAELGTTGLGQRLEALEVKILATDSDDTASDSDSDSSDGDSDSDDESETVDYVTSPTSIIEVDNEFSNREQDASYDTSTATSAVLNGTDITVSGTGATAENGILTIAEAGTYVISGNLTEGQIRVETADTEKVQLVLNGVTINNSSSAAIYLKRADKVFLTLADGTTNTLTDGSEYIQTDDNTVDAVIFSKCDLAINGSGTLNITASYKHGIVSKDELVITDGTYNISAVKTGLNSNDAIKIKDGVFNISSSAGKAITSQHETDTTKGYVYIADGSFTISNCTEGIEGTAIIIEDGNFDITASDDGLNAGSYISTAIGGGREVADPNVYISIAGGYFDITTTNDSIDSNGDLYISGGTIYVSGPTVDNENAMDYDGTAEISGGNVLILGSSGMAQGFSDSSTQASILYNLTSQVAASTKVSLSDASGTVLIEYTPEKAYQSVVVSTPEMSVGSTYILTVGSQSSEIEQTAIVTSIGDTATGTPDGGGGKPPRR